MSSRTQRAPEVQRYRYKHHYDKRSKVREFSVGDKVLLLLPTDRKKLLLHWKGPFPILAKLGSMDYCIDLNGKSKVFHANLLKKYFERPEESATIPNSITSSQCLFELLCTSVIEAETNSDNESNSDNETPKCYSMSNEKLLQLHPLTAKDTIADVNINATLHQEQRREVNRLLGNYPDILTDLPGKTTLGHHTITLHKNELTRSKPYPLPHALRDTVKEEVSTMLKMGVVEPSNAPFASPIVLVKKPDGPNRFCVDFRKLNQVTVL